MWTDDKKCCDIFPQYLWIKNKDKCHLKDGIFCLPNLEKGEYKYGKCKKKRKGI